MAVQQGRGTAIVVSAVDPGSQAAAAGVRVGQQLLEVSDPIRYADTWQLNERASLRYVRECIRMRRDAVMQLVLTGQPIPEWQQAVAAARAAALDAQQPQQEQAADASTGSQDGDDLLSAIVNAAVSGTSSDESDSEAEAAGRPLTMADKLEQRYQQQQVEAAAEARLVQQQMTALQQRQARRRERLEVVSPAVPHHWHCVWVLLCVCCLSTTFPGLDTVPSVLLLPPLLQDDQRNDSKFFAFVAMFFMLPPLIILGVAFGTGYLDSLDPYASMR